MKTSGAVWIGGILQNPKSQHWHWSRHRKWAAGWREVTAWVCRGLVDAPPEAPKHVRLIAHVRRKFDASNLPMVLSPILDGLQAPRRGKIRRKVDKPTKRLYSVKSPDWPGAGVIDDDGNPAHRIEFAQVLDRERQGVEVCVQVLAP